MSDPFKNIMTEFNTEAEKQATLIKNKRNAVRSRNSASVLRRAHLECVTSMADLNDRSLCACFLSHAGFVLDVCF